MRPTNKARLVLYPAALATMTAAALADGGCDPCPDEPGCEPGITFGWDLEGFARIGETMSLSASLSTPPGGCANYGGDLGYFTPDVDEPTIAHSDICPFPSGSDFTAIVNEFDVTPDLGGSVLNILLLVGEWPETSGWDFSCTCFGPCGHGMRIEWNLPVPTLDCPGDFDLDGTVGFHDLNDVLVYWPRPGDWSPYRGIEDLLAVLSSWGPCPTDGPYPGPVRPEVLISSLP